jgi:hypothetical protein
MSDTVIASDEGFLNDLPPLSRSCTMRTCFHVLITFTTTPTAISDAALFQLQLAQKKSEARHHEPEPHQRQSRAYPRKKSPLRREINARVVRYLIRHEFCSR